MSDKKTKTIVFTRKPPKSAYFVGRDQDVPVKEAEEYINLGYAVDPAAVKKKQAKTEEPDKKKTKDSKKSKK